MAVVHVQLDSLRVRDRNGYGWPEKPGGGEPEFDFTLTLYRQNLEDPNKVEYGQYLKIRRPPNGAPQGAPEVVGENPFRFDTEGASVILLQFRVNVDGSTGIIFLDEQRGWAEAGEAVLEFHYNEHDFELIYEWNATLSA